MSALRLTGKRWIVVGVQVGGREAAVPNAEGARLLFDADNGYEVFDSVNTITGGYARSGNTLRVDPGITTLLPTPPRQAPIVTALGIFTTGGVLALAISARALLLSDSGRVIHCVAAAV